MSTGLLIGSIVGAVFVVIAAASAAAETAMTRISRARANGFDPEAHPGAAALVEVLGERETTLASRPSATSSSLVPPERRSFPKTNSWR
ncbi:MAG: hypothetical protein EBY65_07810 [Acidimicrobiia bacterium]|nr:hypothetical protein [Acidimicrobiia bacterium]